MPKQPKKRGQPPKGADALSKDINVRLKPADRTRLEKAGKKGGIGPSAKAREYILEGLKRDNV